MIAEALMRGQGGMGGGQPMGGQMPPEMGMQGDPVQMMVAELVQRGMSPQEAEMVVMQFMEQQGQGGMSGGGMGGGY